MTLNQALIVRGLFLLLFTSSSIVTLINPNTPSTIIAGMCLIGFLVYQALEQVKAKEVPDLTEEFKALRAENDKLARDFQLIKDNISVASAAGMLRR